MITYAPMIESTIPAFSASESESIWLPDEIKINFTHNIAVGMYDIQGFQIILKSLYNNGANEILVKSSYYRPVSMPDAEWVDFLKKGEVIFPEGSFSSVSATTSIAPGNYYKIQMAYIDTSGTLGTFSTVGIARCLGEKPSLSIAGLDLSGPNPDRRYYTGLYSTDDAQTEIVYRYKFDLFVLPQEGEKTLLESSGWQFPAGTDMVFSHRQYLKNDEDYSLELAITTVNGYEDSVVYTIVPPTSSIPITVPDLMLYMSQYHEETRENGYVKLYLENKYNLDGSIATILSKINLALFRHTVGAPDTHWEELTRFSLKANSDLSKFIWKDFTVSHGETYQYAIRAYKVENGVYIWSQEILAVNDAPDILSSDSNQITAYFDYVYLGDSERQLKINLNTQISSFKEVLLEQKTDTLGGKYPIFQRNGTVRYKEIPLSGLISYYMDLETYFDINKECVETAATTLTHSNFMAERKFKTLVLNWLNNGKPKLLRTSAEGSFVVRIMNTSLSPNAQIGRLLHTFSATAYEVAPYELSSMIKNNIASFPLYAEIPEGMEEIRQTTNIQNLTAASVRYTMPRTAARAASLEPELAKVVCHDNANTLLFTLKPEAVDGLHVYDGATGNILTFTNYDSNGNILLNKNELPAEFGIPFEECAAVKQHLIFSREGVNQFDFITDNAQETILSIGVGNDDLDLLEANEFVRIYTLTATPIADVSQETAWLELEYHNSTFERFYFSDGNSRTFTNLDWIKGINKGESIDLTVHALVLPKGSVYLAKSMPEQGEEGNE